MVRSRVLLAGTLLFGAGCYHATVETGATPSTEVVEKAWAASFIAGLVPPAVVETAQKCPHGAARVETQLSFLNQLASFLTLGIFTPMHIKVTCAARRTASARDGDPVVRVGESAPDAAAALEIAAARAQRENRAIEIEF